MSELIHNRNADIIGLTESVSYSCNNCKHHAFTSYAVQGDSGINYWCTNPNLQALTNQQSILIEGFSCVSVDALNSNVQECCKRITPNTSWLIAQQRDQLLEALKDTVDGINLADARDLISKIEATK